MTLLPISQRVDTPLGYGSEYPNGERMILLPISTLEGYLPPLLLATAYPELVFSLGPAQ